MKKVYAILLFACISNISFTQNKSKTFTRQDTLRGSITPERAWWDLTYYHLSIKVGITDSTVKGFTEIHYKVLESKNLLQVDLQQPLKITRMVQNGKDLIFKRDGNAWLAELTEPQRTGELKSIRVYYEGKPRAARLAPWDGGFSWKKDKNGKPFIATSCQGLGASAWWPCKDHMYDEPDSMLISVNVPKELSEVSNGRLRKIEEHTDLTRTFHWFVSNPINNYGVNINIGDYVHFSEIYLGEKGPLDCHYYVLRDNLEKAKKQFAEVPRILKAFEHWFGPYPFYEDGYKLVEVPYLGMEHQSSVTYGNGYQNGYLGRDLSGSGWGLKFDYIIVHESGHEWFANNITYRDIADMWIHEGFTYYSEFIFLEYHFGKKAASEYCIGSRKNISNLSPIIGPYDVNEEGSGDMYPKGANLIHTLRQLVEDDEKWRSLLRGMNETFRHQTVTTQQIEDYMSKKIGLNLQPVFDQYLRDIRIPELQYYFKGKQLYYRWSNCVEGFNLPVNVRLNGKEVWLEPTFEWKTLPITTRKKILVPDSNFYIKSALINPE